MEFKLEAVKQVVEHGRPVTDVADGLGVNRNLLTRWKSMYTSAGEVTVIPVDQEQLDLASENRRLRRELSIARQEREILKSGGLLRERVELRFQFVRDHREMFEVGLMCKTLRASRSGFYAWLDRPESDRARENRRLIALIQGAFEESRRTYGSPRVHAVLRHRGVRCGQNRVARLMKKQGLRPRLKKKFRVETTDSNHDNPIAPNLLDQNFEAERPNLIWVSDITYIPTDEGFDLLHPGNIG